MMLAVQATGAVAVESPYRRRVYFASWAFNIGQAVKYDGVPALVLSRERTAMGVELYRIWITRQSAGRPYRTVRKHFLITINQDCPFK